MGQTTAVIYQRTDMEDETVSQAAKGPLAARHQGWLPHRSPTAELKRRWTSIKKSAKSPPAAGKGATTAAGIVKLPAALDTKQMAAMNLIFLTNEISPMTGSPLYVYGPAAAKVKAAELSIRDRALGKKCKREEEEEDDDDDDDDDDNMTWACEVAAMRLLKKCKKETLIMLCNDFGIPTSGNKEKLAEEAAEQLHYETDDESDDDE